MGKNWGIKLCNLFPSSSTSLILIKVAILGCAVTFTVLLYFGREMHVAVRVDFLLSSWDVKRNKQTGMHVKSQLQARHLLLFLFGSWFEGLMFWACVSSNAAVMLNAHLVQMSPPSLDLEDDAPCIKFLLPNRCVQEQLFRKMIKMKGTQFQKKESKLLVFI